MIILDRPPSNQRLDLNSLKLTKLISNLLDLMRKFPSIDHHNGLNAIQLDIDFVQDGDQIGCGLARPVFCSRDYGTTLFDQWD